MTGPASSAICVVDALRTPIGTAGRGLAGLTAPELAAPVISALVARLDAGGGVGAAGAPGAPGGCLGGGARQLHGARR